MRTFQYEAIDVGGQIQTGALEAADRTEAQSRLSERGLVVRTLEPTPGVQPGRVSAFSEREVTALLEQLQTLTRSGLPLPSGLRAAGSELESPSLRTTFLRLADHLERGVGLDLALVVEAKRFPAHLQGLVLAGARTGRLADVLAEVVQSGNLGEVLRRKVWASVAYPLVILGVVVVLVCFICHLSTQIIEGLYDMNNGFFQATQLSPVASAMFAITRFVADYDFWFLSGLSATTLVALCLWRFVISPPARRRMLESVPLLGPMVQFVSLAEFCHLSALLVEAETPLPEALELAGASVRDASLSEISGRIASAVAGGQTLSSALQLWKTLPAGLGQLLSWGEQQQTLAEALRFAGDMFETRAEAQATFSSQILSASLLVLILWWLGFAVASIYLPLSYTLRFFL